MAGDLSQRLLATFIDELEEQVGVLNENLLALEANPHESDRLRAVFRVMHTLKGAARAAAVRPVEELTHAVEDRIASAREGAGALTPAQVEMLFRAADALADAGQRLRSSQPVSEGILPELLHELRAMSQVRTEQAAPPSTRSQAAHPVAARPVAAPPVAAPPMSEPAAPEPDVATLTGAAREESVRVGVTHLDAMFATAGELLGVTGSLSDRPAQLSLLLKRVVRARSLLRGKAGAPGQKLHTDTYDALETQLAAIERDLGDLARETRNEARNVIGTTTRLLRGVRRLRQRRIGDIFEPLPRVVRDVAVTVGKQAELVIEGQTIEADRAVIDALREPLVHLVRNAVDHGLETPDERVRAGKPPTGTVRVAAALQGDILVVTVSDDGAGVNTARLREMLLKRGVQSVDDDKIAETLLLGGITTRTEASSISGRGVGLDIVRVAAERLGGTVDVDWEPRRGTRFTIHVPVSIATLRAVLVDAGGAALAIPAVAVERIVQFHADDVSFADGRPFLRTHKQPPMPLTSAARLLGPPLRPPSDDARNRIAVIVTSVSRKLALVVDDVHEFRDLVVRPIEAADGTVPPQYAGVALLPGGRIALVLNATQLLAGATRILSEPELARGVAGQPVAVKPHLLIVDDSITTRTLEQSVLSAAGYRVSTAVDGLDALRILEAGGVELVVSDIEMPNMNGIELCEAIRKSERFSTLPLILVTSLDDEVSRARGLEAGANAYIAKSSFDQDTLLATVKQLLDSEP